MSVNDAVKCGGIIVGRRLAAAALLLGLFSSACEPFRPRRLPSESLSAAPHELSLVSAPGFGASASSPLFAVRFPDPGGVARINRLSAQAYAVFRLGDPELQVELVDAAGSRLCRAATALNTRNLPLHLVNGQAWNGRSLIFAVTPQNQKVLRHVAGFWLFRLEVKGCLASVGEMQAAEALSEADGSCRCRLTPVPPLTAWTTRYPRRHDFDEASTHEAGSPPSPLDGINSSAESELEAEEANVGWLDGTRVDDSQAEYGHLVDQALPTAKEKSAAMASAPVLPPLRFGSFAHVLIEPLIERVVKVRDQTALFSQTVHDRRLMILDDLNQRSMLCDEKGEGCRPTRRRRLLAPFPVSLCSSGSVGVLLCSLGRREPEADGEPDGSAGSSDAGLQADGIPFALGLFDRAQDPSGPFARVIRTFEVLLPPETEQVHDLWVEDGGLAVLVTLTGSDHMVGGQKGIDRRSQQHEFRAGFNVVRYPWQQRTE